MSTFKSNQGDISNEDLAKRERFWNKKQFQTWSKKELERSSTKMQNLLNALKETTHAELLKIRKMNMYELYKYPVKSKEYIIWVSEAKEIEYAIFIAPKTFKVKQG